MAAGVYEAASPILHSLFRESERCAAVMYRLSHMHHVLSCNDRRELDHVRREINKTRCSMISFADLLPIHVHSIHLFLNHLQLAISSVSKTLDDIQSYCSRHRLSQQELAIFCHLLLDDSNGGLYMSRRFATYTKFFEILADAITESPNFDIEEAKSQRKVILDFKDFHGQRMPHHITTFLYPFSELPAACCQSFVPHWAEMSVDRRPKLYTRFDKEGQSKTYGPYDYWDAIEVPKNSLFLFKRTFRDEEISLTVYINHTDKLPYALLRTTFDAAPCYECRPLHELRIMRSDTKLHLSRWSASQRGFVHWAVLHFEIFEELVVIHCTLLSLKGQMSVKPHAISHDEAIFRDEWRIWEAYAASHDFLKRDIIDGGVRHKLAINQDLVTGTKRLHACVGKRERQTAYTPAWTIFFSNKRIRPYIEYIDDYRLVIYDSTLYTFGNSYLTSKHDARRFEITFLRRDDAREFKQLFDEPVRNHRYSV